MPTKIRKLFKKILLPIFSFLLIFYCFGALALSAETSSGTTGSGPTSVGSTGSSVIKIESPFKDNIKSIPDFIKIIIEKIMMPIGGMVAVLMIMYAGFMYVTAQGDTGKISKAHDALLYAVIGAAVLLGAWVISQAIGGTIDQLKR